MKFLFLLAVLFTDGTPARSKVFIGFPDTAACEQARKDMAAEATARGVEVWTSCIEVSRDVKPQAEPKHRDPKSEVQS